MFLCLENILSLNQNSFAYLPVPSGWSIIVVKGQVFWTTRFILAWVLRARECLRGGKCGQRMGASLTCLLSPPSDPLVEKQDSRRSYQQAVVRSSGPCDTHHVLRCRWRPDFDGGVLYTERWLPGKQNSPGAERGPVSAHFSGSHLALRPKS